MERIIRISDPVYTFSEIMDHIDLHQCFAAEERKTGRPTYDREKLLKNVLFAFMEFGYCSVRQIEKLCETDILFLWILDEEKAPSFMTIQNFIHNELQNRVEVIFSDLNQYILRDADKNHVYIDGTKLKANAGNYTWVWKDFGSGSDFIHNTPWRMQATEALITTCTARKRVWKGT